MLRFIQLPDSNHILIFSPNKKEYKIVLDWIYDNIGRDNVEVFYRNAFYHVEIKFKNQEDIIAFKLEWF